MNYIAGRCYSEFAYQSTIMGTMTSSFERPPSGSSGNDVDDIHVTREFVPRQQLVPASKPKMNYYKCDSDGSLRSSQLPGQVASNDSIFYGSSLSDDMSYGESIHLSDYALKNQTEDEELSKLGSEPNLPGRTSNTYVALSSDSMACMNRDTKRFPALTVCERPKRVKSAMFESLLVAVPSLKRLNSAGKENKHKNSRRQSSSRKGNSCNPKEESEELENSSSSSWSASREKALEIWEKKGSNDSFSTSLFSKDLAAFDRQRVLSRVDEVLEEV